MIEFLFIFGWRVGWYEQIWLKFTINHGHKY